MSSLLSEFTSLYGLSKTLRFELKPVGKTKEYLSKDDFFKEDTSKADSYSLMKQLLDGLHRDYINEALAKVTKLSIDLEPDYIELRKEIASYFTNSKLLGEKDTINQLLQRYPEHKIHIEQFQGFRGYFKTYKQNRENLYKNEGKAGQIATRLIDENLPRFLKNKQIIESSLLKLSDFSVIEKNEKQEQKSKLIKDYSVFFDIGNYYYYLTQASIDAYNQTVGHFNHSINLYKQQNGAVKIPLLQLLYKLPLAPKEAVHWLPQQLENDEQLLQTIQSVKSSIDTSILPFIQTILQPTLSSDNNYDRHGIYISLKTLEHRGGIGLTGWSSFREMTHDLSKAGDDPKLKKEYKDFPFVSLQQVKDYLDEKQKGGIEHTAIFGEGKAKDIGLKSYNTYFFELVASAVHEIIVSYQDAKQNYEQGLTKDNQKKLMDTSLSLRRLLGGFILVHKKVRLNPNIKESYFYDGEKGLDAAIFDDNDDPIHTSYDKVRNYLTKKPYSNDDKIKVNFENPTLLDGRDQNKERNNSGILLRKNGLYYLAILKKGHNIFFDEKRNNKLYDGSGYEKLIYKLLPGPNKMFPKVIFSKKNIDFFSPPKEIIRIRSQESFKQGEGFSLKDLHTWIDFLKDALGKYEGWKCYDFNFKKTSEYQKINEFYQQVESQGYSMKWKNIDEDMCDQEIEKGNLYLFQIHNKDFGMNSSGNSNLHTKYFLALFAGGDNNLFKLNGEAEIFWRKATLERQTKGKSPKHQVEIIEKRRYTEDKLMLHIPITLNFCRNETKFNDLMKKTIKEKVHGVTILGIDRGEKHLLYYSLMKQDGTIIKTGSRNVIANKIKQVDYHQKLEEREIKRDEAQLNRDQQEQIKDLKSGYISQVIHEISKIVIDHNAIIVLEDLNSGFKRGRQKVEKNVYQQFELALAKKLNYLVFKKTPDNQAGGTMKGYQLTPPVAGFKDLSFQTGIIFYTPAGYTSTTCPSCGWRKNLYLKYQNEKSAKEELKKISMSKTNDYYTITYTVPQDTTKGKSDTVLNKTQRTLTSKNQHRNQYNRTTKQDLPHDITGWLNTLFDQGNFDYASWLGQASVTQCKTLIRVLNLLMKIRNAKTGTEIDIIQCPACGFHSNQGFQGHQYNGDANGAYNIARKGAIILKKISDEEKSTIVRQFECDNERSK